MALQQWAGQLDISGQEQKYAERLAEWKKRATKNKPSTSTSGTDRIAPSIAGGLRKRLDLLRARPALWPVFRLRTRQAACLLVGISAVTCSKNGDVLLWIGQASKLLASSPVWQLSSSNNDPHQRLRNLPPPPLPPPPLPRRQPNTPTPLPAQTATTVRR